MKVRFTVYDQDSIPAYDLIIPRVDTIHYDNHYLSFYMDDGRCRDYPLTSFGFTLEVIE